jgi:hypothetical protein
MEKAEYATPAEIAIFSYLTVDCRTVIHVTLCKRLEHAKQIHSVLHLLV